MPTKSGVCSFQILIVGYWLNLRRSFVNEYIATSCKKRHDRAYLISEVCMSSWLVCLLNCSISLAITIRVLSSEISFVHDQVMLTKA